ncbi:YdiU family protein [Anatilimnocola sp. NA78]|uniref:protein adenylyltransferase SelO n=1 Tax=Anatilimnocola sp. NA78 TaxID=3415683 RepID=UPI003CE54B4B
MSLSESGTEHNDIGARLENTYSRLPQVLFAPAQPAKVRSPRLSILNERLADELGFSLAQQSPERLASIFAGQELLPGSQPIAQAYAGHQFGGFTMLGDGRAILLGELRLSSGKLVDIQLKGAGQTQYSRRGDGRAALGPMLREYVISEALCALGIPTTRSLAVVTTGEPVYRTPIQKGAVLTRVAASHIRVGTFQYLAAIRDNASLQLLADYTIARHYPTLMDAPNKYQQFLRAVIDRQAALIAQWQCVGFIHGVMNTDNMAISGETIDYGPCAFMNNYHQDTVFSSIDHGGRYAYGNQPTIAQWNLARFAETLLPLLHPEQQQAIDIAMAALTEYTSIFEGYWLGGLRKKLGLQTSETGDADLIRSLLAWMQSSAADFTNTFRSLASSELPVAENYQAPEFRAWHATWQERLRREGRPLESIYSEMQSINPAVIPRNHRVEEALSAAEENDDLSVLHRLLAALSSPYRPTAATAPYQEPPRDECGYRTFCGT